MLATRLGVHPEELLDVRFVPPVREEGWTPDRPDDQPVQLTPARPAPLDDARIASSIALNCEAFTDIASADLEPLLARIGAARVVLIGEASHGTSEFYRFRARITRQLIERGGFAFVAIEGDWPDAYRVGRSLRGAGRARHAEEALRGFRRFPTWMWRNA